jgi:RNA polymerase primary sigma factor
MAKQKSMRSSFEDDFSVDFAGEFDAGMEHEVETPADVNQLGAAAETGAPGALSPEAALESLLALGRAQGYVSYDDVLKVMPEAESSMEQLEDIFASLFEQGIEVGQAREEEPDVLGRHQRRRDRGCRDRGGRFRSEPDRDR